MRVILHNLNKHQYVSLSQEDNRICTKDTISNNEILTLIKNSNGTVSLMTSHGHFIGSMEDGTVFTTNHIKDWEMWTMMNNEKKGTISFLSAHEEYLSCPLEGDRVTTSPLCGDSERFIVHYL